MKELFVERPFHSLPTRSPRPSAAFFESVFPLTEKLFAFIYKAVNPLKYGTKCHIQVR